MALVESIGVRRKHVDVVGFSSLVIQGFRCVLSESKVLIVQKFWNRLDNHRFRHSGIGIIDELEFANSDIATEHNKTGSVRIVRVFNEGILETNSVVLAQLLGSPCQTQVRVKIGCLLELSAPMERRSGNETNIVVVIEKHPVEDLVDSFAGKSLEMAAGWLGNLPQELA